MSNVHPLDRALPESIERTIEVLWDAIADDAVARHDKSIDHDEWKRRARKVDPAFSDFCASIHSLVDRVEIAEAKSSVIGGEWCANNRSEGRGPCGACSLCCADAIKRAEEAERLLKMARSACSEDLSKAIDSHFATYIK